MEGRREIRQKQNRLPLNRQQMASLHRLSRHHRGWVVRVCVCVCVCVEEWSLGMSLGIAVMYVHVKGIVKAS